MLLLGAIALRLWIVCERAPIGFYDDAYITFRYAANLAAGQGLVFNVGERVWETTTPLFALSLALPGWWFGKWAIPWAAAFAGVAAAAVLLLALGAAFETAGRERDESRAESALAPWPALALLAVVGFAPSFLDVSTSGMETSLVLAGMAGGLWLLERRRFALAGVCAGALILLRFDTAFWLTLTFVWAWATLLRHRRQLLRAAVVATLTALPWYAFAWMYYGTLLPQSAKGKAYSHQAFAVLDWQYIREFARILLPVPDRVVPLVAAWAVVALLVSAATWRCWRRRSLWLVWPAFFLGYGGILLASKTPIFLWYFAPAELALWISLALGASETIERLPATPWRQRAVVAAVLLGTIALVPRGLRFAAHSFDPEHSGMWRDVADVALQLTRPDEAVMLEHIGLVGFASARPVVDVMGLVSPDVLDLSRSYWPDKTSADAYRAFVEAMAAHYRPGVVVEVGLADPALAARLAPLGLSEVSTLTWSRGVLTFYDRPGTASPD